MGKKRQQPGSTVELVLDPEDRKKFLKGFSERKRQRRAYGLAMQKVKDRKSNLEQRAERRKAMQEQIEQAEKQKEILLESTMYQNEGSNHVLLVPCSSSRGEDENMMRNKKIRPRNKVKEPPTEMVRHLEDVQTMSQWGGKVVVTTSMNFDDSEDETNIRPMKKKQKKSLDEEQEYAGSVDKFISQFKGSLPGKRKKRNERSKSNPSNNRKNGSLKKLKGGGGGGGGITGNEGKLNEKTHRRGKPVGKGSIKRSK